MAKRSRTPQLPSCYRTDGAVQSGNDESDPSVPFVEHHDGRRFWSDRFYLNSTTTEPSDAHNSSNCSCESSQEPPEFPLIDFVNHSLDVKTSVMGTFNLHPEWFRQNFPRFGTKEDSIHDAGSSVPTFILHGHRGLENALAKRVKQADELEYETDREEEDENDKDSKRNSNLPIDGNSSSKFQFFLPSTQKATETARHFVDNPSLQLWQVHCNWEKSSKKSPRVSSGKENSERTKTTRETKFGVHHPKFFLLFEKSGDLVVIVTTSNLTPTNRCTAEGSWVQRFRRRNGTERKRQDSDNDFGLVLQDFLVRLSEAAAAGPRRETQTPLADSSKKRLSLEDFLWKHVGIQSLAEFSSRYHFETAQTYLVPIIPGDYQYDPNDASPTRCFYGRQRVRYILEKLAVSTPKISKKTQDKSKSDRLLFQPTSLGSDWSRSQFASLIREYMGYYGGGNTNISKSPSKTTVTSTKRKSPNKKQKTSYDISYHRDDFWVCNQADIVWPSDRFMVDVAKTMQSAESGASSMISPLQAATRKDGKEETVMKSFVFNSSRTFNACDLEFISRMAKYQPSSNNEKCNAKAPHFKSIARIFQNHAAMQKRDVPPADTYFSWFLLTSACLSLGAQGAAIENEKEDTSLASTVSYRNFELGVLFASHLPKKAKAKGIDQERKSVVYCFRPHKCSCDNSSSSQPQLVHLPVPYSIKSDSYFNDNEDDDEDMVMNENPFFHEILDGSRCIGNMLLTPFGQHESNQTTDL